MGDLKKGDNRMDINVIFWGTGKTAKKFITNHPLFMEQVYVVGFTDTDSRKWGKLFEQYEVEKPFIILQKKYDYIIVLSIFWDEIKNALMTTYFVPPKRILSVDDSYELFLKLRYGTNDGRCFCSPQLLAGLSCSDKIYKRLLKEENECLSYLYLKEKYLPYIQGMEGRKEQQGFSINTVKTKIPIWVCWLQGIESAPDIVKCCINSIRQNAEGILHIITYENYSSYVDIEKIIIEKHEAGLISKTHFSDILRLALLYKYGGIWMDATVLLMEFGLPDFVYELPLFMYKIRTTMDEDYNDPRKFSSWLISAQKSNPLIGMTYEFLNYYWSIEVSHPYYLMHYVIRMLWDKYDSTDKGKLILYNCNCRILDKLLDKPYDMRLWESIKKEQLIQKLTYKRDFISRNTFYGHICDVYMNL